MTGDPPPVEIVFRPARRWLVIASPILLITLCHLVQRLAGGSLGILAVLPTLLVFWLVIAALVLSSVGMDGVRRWLGPARGAWRWRVLALTLGLMSLPNLVMHWPVLKVPAMAAAWLAFAVVNPWLEEAYWRGLLLDATRGWGAWLSVAYASSWFAVSHPLIWGVQVPAMWKPQVVIALFVVGALWSVAYRRSGSLRWPIAGHFLANILGLAGPVLLHAVEVG